MLRVFIQNEAGSNLKNYHDEKTLEWKSSAQVARAYPYPYGFVIDTSAADGCNVDCFVITVRPLGTGDIVECEPIGLMEQIEDGEDDHNVLAAICGEAATVDKEVEQRLTEFVDHVFEPVPGRQIEVGRFLGPEAATAHVSACRNNARAIKAVFFDLDGTLYDRDLLVAGLVAEQYHAFRDELRGVSQDQFGRRIVELDDHGYADKSAVYQTVAVEWGLNTDLSSRLVDDFWLRYHAHCVVTDDVLFTLKTLRDHGLRLGVITNGRADWQRQKLDALGITSWFETILISESEGVKKPDAEIFHRALSRCGVRAREAVFVGDHPEADIAGATAAGLLAIWKFVPYWPLTLPGVQRVHQLSEILPICISS
jgi:putative hydrolase of the HAD superfamily